MVKYYIEVRIGKASPEIIEVDGYIFIDYLGRHWPEKIDITKELPTDCDFIKINSMDTISKQYIRRVWKESEWQN